jgi:malate dehydrogenase (quinone)
MNTRLKELRNFYPEAKADDWKLIDAGIRVQAIKKEDGDAGIVHFGTEVVTTADKSVSSLLGASPGASVCVNVVLEVARKCFGELLGKEEAQIKLKKMIPTHDLDLRSMKGEDEIAKYREWSHSAEKALGLLRD